MQAFELYKGKDASFWAFIKFISESLGYTKRGTGQVKQYSPDEIKKLCRKKRINVSDEEIILAAQYSRMRADLLNSFVEKMLMDDEAAKEEFLRLEKIHSLNGYRCKLPLNKQKGEMKQIAFFTAIINILAEKTIRNLSSVDNLGFDDDPRGLAIIRDKDNRIIGASSRRFDGAYPTIENPTMVWEIKEYYYATTFGSRVADGVYETQLDGLEFKELFERTSRKVYHVLFIDAYRTWWIQGKSYLCRIIDALNSGVVDEVIVGREVLTRWPELIESVITSK